MMTDKEQQARIKILRDYCMHITILEAYTIGKLDWDAKTEADRLELQAISRMLRKLKSMLRDEVNALKGQ